MEIQVLRTKRSNQKSYVTGRGCPVVSPHPANECKAKLLLGWKSLRKYLSPMPEQLRLKLGWLAGAVGKITQYTSGFRSPLWSCPRVKVNGSMNCWGAQTFPRTLLRRQPTRTAGPVPACPPDHCHCREGLPVDSREGILLPASSLAENFHLYFIGFIHNKGCDYVFKFQ